MFGVTYLEKVAKLLDLAPKQKSEVIKELESHITFTTEELIEQGIPTDEARSEAENRMGTPEDVALRINAEYNTASWKTAIFAALPFLASFLLMLLPKTSHIQLVGIIVIGIVASIFSVRELIKDRRPVWLAPCLLLAIACFGAIGTSIFGITKASDKYNNIAYPAFVIVSFSLMSIITTYAYRKWFGTTAILSFLCFICTFFIVAVNTNLFIKGGLVCLVLVAIIIMGIMFSRCIFEFHKYGNAMQASIFLLSTYAFSVSPDILYQAGINTLIAVVMIILVTRAPSRQSKLRIMKHAILCFAIIGALFNPNQKFSGVEQYVLGSLIAIIQGCIYAFPMRWLILYPIRCENKQYDVEPPFAVR
jgi:hypothetical protein